jgi:hypothetical protein
MAIPNPQTWTSMNLNDQYQMQNFLQQLAQWATQTQNPFQLINSQAGSVQGGSLQTVSKYLNGVSGTQTVACANAANVMVEINFTADTTLVLASLSVGVPVVVKATNTGGAGHVLKMNGTSGNGTTYAISGKGSGLVDFVATGVTIGAGGTGVFAGNSDMAGATPSLWFLYN